MLTQVQENLAQFSERIDGEIGELRHQYQGFDEKCMSKDADLVQVALYVANNEANIKANNEANNKLAGVVDEMRHKIAPLVERDLVGGIAQMQINLDRSKVATQELLANKLRELEERIAALPAPSSVKIARQMQVDRLNDIEARLVKLERGYKAMASMYTQTCDMYDTFVHMTQVPTEHMKLAIELAEKLGSIGSIGSIGSDIGVQVVSLADLGESWDTEPRAEQPSAPTYGGFASLEAYDVWEQQWEPPPPTPDTPSRSDA